MVNFISFLITLNKIVSHCECRGAHRIQQPPDPIHQVIEDFWSSHPWSNRRFIDTVCVFDDMQYNLIHNHHSHHKCQSMINIYASFFSHLTHTCLGSLQFKMKETRSINKKVVRVDQHNQLCYFFKILYNNEK